MSLRLIASFLILSLLLGCSTEIDLNAPQKDIWVVYGILNPSDSIQYIRVSRGFLIEGDALEYAKNTDLSEKGLQVVLAGDNLTLTGEQVDSVLKDPEDGIFYAYTTLYQFRTSGNTAIEPAEEFELRITRGDDPDFELTSETEIPELVEFTTPPRNHRPGAGGSRCLAEAALDRDYTVEFNIGKDAPGRGFEIRAFLDYTENGVFKTASFGPTSLFSGNVGCSPRSGSDLSRCYEFRANDILISFFNDIDPQFGNVYEYDITDSNGCQNDVEDLPDALRFEVTAVDQNIRDYRLVNDPLFVDFNTVRPEFTNITGPDSAITLGLFGSISVETATARLSPCSEYILQLNETPEPQDECSL